MTLGFAPTGIDWVLAVISSLSGVSSAVIAEVAGWLIWRLLPIDSEVTVLVAVKDGI